jgi:hypothetical protein
LKTLISSLDVLGFPLFRAEHRRGGRIKAHGLSESRRSLGEGGASFRVLRPPRRRAGLSGTRAFSFASVFCHVTENEETIYLKEPLIGKTSPGPPPEVGGLDQS